MDTWEVWPDLTLHRAGKTGTQMSGNSIFVTHSLPDALRFQRNCLREWVSTDLSTIASITQRLVELGEE